MIRVNKVPGTVLKISDIFKIFHMVLVMSEGKLNKGSFSHGGASALMIHGIQGTSSSWEKVVASCHSKVLFTLPDLRGRGDAFRGKDVRDYTLSAYVSDLKQAMSVIGNSNRSPFFLIGWSMN